LENKTMRTSLFTALSIGLSLLTAGALAEAEPAKPLALRGIMQDLGRHMQTVTLAIAREDWALAEKTAPLIASHPQPPLMEKTRILTFVGTDMGKYKSHDHKTHEAAHALGQAARNQDGVAVIAAFQSIQTGCYGCHREFRKPFVEHFYRAR
jgi:cytochrome c556